MKVTVASTVYSSYRKGRANATQDLPFPLFFVCLLESPSRGFLFHFTSIIFHQEESYYNDVLQGEVSLL